MVDVSIAVDPLMAGPAERDHIGEVKAEFGMPRPVFQMMGMQPARNRFAPVAAHTLVSVSLVDLPKKGAAFARDVSALPVGRCSSLPIVVTRALDVGLGLTLRSGAHRSLSLRGAFVGRSLRAMGNMARMTATHPAPDLGAAIDAEPLLPGSTDRESEASNTDGTFSIPRQRHRADSAEAGGDSHSIDMASPAPFARVERNWPMAVDTGVGWLTPGAVPAFLGSVVDDLTALGARMPVGRSVFLFHRYIIPAITKSRQPYGRKKNAAHSAPR